VTTIIKIIHKEDIVFESNTNSAEVVIIDGRIVWKKGWDND